jgi:hypothetical protein
MNMEMPFLIFPLTRRWKTIFKTIFLNPNGEKLSPGGKTLMS